MEAATPVPAAERSTGAAPNPDLIGLAAERYADRAAVRHKRSGAWEDVTFRELGAIVSEVARGLIDLGLEAGDRIAILCTTRPEWTYCDYGATSAGAVVGPFYATNSPEECEWVVGNSESRMVVCEDAAQVAKIVAVRERLPRLEQIVVIDPEGADGSAVALADLRARGRERAPGEVAARARAVKPEDPYTFIYTSGTTGPPKGCVLTHGNYRSMVSMVEQEGILGTAPDEDVAYLYLPLAHSYALLIQLLCTDLGVTLAYFGGDVKQIVPELM